MTSSARREVRNELLSRIPAWYSPWGHLFVPAAVGLVIAVEALSRIQNLRVWQVALFPVFLVIGNAVEWRAHKGILHRRVRLLEVLYRRHNQHHQVYVTESMTIQDPRELKLVLLPAAGVLAIFAFAIPIAALFVIAGQRNLGCLWVAASVLYVLVYEWLHLSYHLPPDSFVGRLPLVRLLSRHHAIHHSPLLMQRWNFNVTAPLWDWVRGTSYLERAAQAAATGKRPAWTGNRFDT